MPFLGSKQTMMLGCHIRPITHLETGKWVKTHPKQWVKMCWTLLCPIQVPFQVQVGPKMGIFGVDFFAQYGILSFQLYLSHKSPIFGPTWTWNDTWMGHKSAQNIFPHCLGCVLAHYPVSRWVIGLVWQPTMMVHFEPKKGLFWPPPDLKMAPGEGLMASSHLAICIRELLVHFEFKVRINGVGRAKNLPKQAKNG